MAGYDDLNKFSLFCKERNIAENKESRKKFDAMKKLGLI